MALPSVVSPSSSSSPDPNRPLMSVQAVDSPSRLLFDGMLFSNPDFASIFVDHNQDSNHSSHSNHAASLHSDGLASSTFVDHSPQQQQQQYFDFSSDPQQQPGTSSQQTQASSLLIPTSPATSPQSSLELSSLQQSLEKNRESLKHKLSHRASIRELVCRGIYPSPRIPIGHVEQRRKLERAKTGDLLRHHIQSRPDREYLIGQNILQADGRIDVRIAARQKELKKCRLAENLNQHLVTRPGPLDLVDRNILEAPQQLHIAIRSGLLGPISSTKVETVPEISMTGDPGQAQPYYTSVDASMPSPAAFVFDPVIAPGTTVVHATPATSTTAIPMILSNQQLAVYTPLNTIAGVVTSNAHPCDYVILQQPEQQPQPDLGPPSFSMAAAPTTARSKTSSSNFKGAKAQGGTSQRSKTQTLKFHEYKGPPDVVKAKQQQQPDSQPAAQSRRLSMMSDSVAREHISALISQQALYLKYQKYSPGGNGSPPAHNGSVTQNTYQTSSTSSAISLSLSPLSASSSSSIPVNVSSSISSSLTSSTLQPTTTAAANLQSDATNGDVFAVDRMVTRQTLADLRVADLKSYCRQLGLPISGTKQTLVDRLDARLNASRQQMPTVPSHSSSALFFTDGNGVITPMNGRNHHEGTHQDAKPEARSEEGDDVITISSSASSPGIVHDNEGSISGNVANQQSSFGWYGAQPTNFDASNEQLLRLHNRVESQQRHIEQLKAELQLERQKRMDENPSLDTMVGNTPCDASMSLDTWPKSNQPADNLLPAPATNGLESAQNAVGVNELDDIMDLIGAFPDMANAGQNGGSHFMMHDESPSPREPNSNGSWHLADFGLTHGDMNSSASPMSPWLFDNDNNLQFSSSDNNSSSANAFLAPNYGEQVNGNLMLPSNDEFFTQNSKLLSRASFT